MLLLEKTHDQGTENKGHDNHLDHAQEGITEGFQLIAEIWEQITDQGTEGQADQNLGTQANFFLQGCISFSLVIKNSR